MQIAVCLKIVPDNTTIKLDVFNIKIMDGVVETINFADLCALEEAVRFKEKNAETNITIVSVSSQKCKEILRKGLAMGADEAVHLLTEGTNDTFTVGQILTEFFNSQRFDLILVGSQSSDTASGALAAVLAEDLGYAYSAHITSLEEVTKKSICFFRSLERGDRELLECPLPAVLAVKEGINLPRYPALPSLMTALRAEVKEDMVRLTVASSKYVLKKIGPPRPRPKKTFIPDSNLPAIDRMKALLTGGMSAKKQSSILEGTPEKVVAQLIEFMKKEKII